MHTLPEDHPPTTDLDQIGAVLRILKGRTTVIDEAVRLNINVATVIAWMQAVEKVAQRSLTRQSR